MNKAVSQLDQCNKFLLKDKIIFYWNINTQNIVL
jgi:hypothetical protein